MLWLAVETFSNSTFLRSNLEWHAIAGQQHPQGPAPRSWAQRARWVKAPITYVTPHATAGSMKHAGGLGRSHNPGELMFGPRKSIDGSSLGMRGKFIGGHEANLHSGNGASPSYAALDVVQARVS